MKIIKNITAEGIAYVDDLGNDCFVDFKECNRNWIQYRIRTEKLHANEFENLKQIDKCVGQRDICADPKFIEFFTSPKFTRFNFEKSAEYQNPEENFTKTQERILTAGWTTLDLS